MVFLLGWFQVAPERGGGGGGPAAAAAAAAKNTLRISNQTLGSFRGGSLPNVSAGAPTVKTAPHIKDSNKVTFFFSGEKRRKNLVVAVEGKKEKEGERVLSIFFGIKWAVRAVVTMYQIFISDQETI